MAIIAQHVPVPGCSVAEVLRWKVQLPESAERQVAESAQMFLCGNMDLPTTTLEDARRLEVVVDGLPLHGGAQLAGRTTLVSALHGDGGSRRGASDRDGVALMAAQKRKEQSYPEFLGARCRARLVVLADRRSAAGFHARLAGSSLNSRGPVPRATLRS